MTKPSVHPYQKLGFIWIFVLGIFFHTPISQARVFHWPEICSEGDLRIQNNSNQEMNFILQEFEPHLKNETSIRVPARSHQRIYVRGFSESRPNLRLALVDFVYNSSLSPKISFDCLGQSMKATDLQSGLWKFSKKSNLQSHKIWVKNLSYGHSNFKITTYDSIGVAVSTHSFSAAAFEQKSLILKSPQNWSRFEIETTDKMTFFYLDQLMTISPTEHLSLSQIERTPSAVYFEVVSNQNEKDSFVVKIEDPAMIAKARALIIQPSHEKILVGEISMGSGGFNLNRGNGKAYPWSWHVRHVTSFSDFASTACNGLPQFVEDRVQSWVQDPGHVCLDRKSVV